MSLTGWTRRLLPWRSTCKRSPIASAHCWRRDRRSWHLGSGSDRPERPTDSAGRASALAPGARAQGAAMDHRRDCGRGAAGGGRRVVAHTKRRAGPDLYPVSAGHRRRWGFASRSLIPDIPVTGDGSSGSDITRPGRRSGRYHDATCSRGAPGVSDRGDSCASGRTDGFPGGAGSRRQRHLGGQRWPGRPSSADRL